MCFRKIRFWWNFSNNSFTSARFAIAAVAFQLSINPARAATVRINDGQNNHDWKSTTLVLKQIREHSGKFAVAFSLVSVSVDDLMRVSDAGGIMPPKSTWFEPKLRDGLLSHVI